MKNLENNSDLLQDLSIEEMESVNGGWFQAAIALAGACIYLYNNMDDFTAGFREGWSRN